MSVEFRSYEEFYLTFAISYRKYITNKVVNITYCVADWLSRGTRHSHWELRMLFPRKSLPCSGPSLSAPSCGEHVSQFALMMGLGMSLISSSGRSDLLHFPPSSDAVPWC